MNATTPRTTMQEPPTPEQAKPRKRGRPTGDQEGKRKELLQAGIRVIAERGFADASLRKVAKEAGHTTGAVSYYFENKDALFEAIVEYLFDVWDQILSLPMNGDGLKSRYKRWLALNSDSDSWLAGFQLLTKARHEPKLAAIYGKRYGEYRAELSRNIALQQAHGEVRKDIEADVLADVIGTIGDGWMLMQPIEPQRFTPERVEKLIDSVVRLLAPQDHPD